MKDSSLENEGFCGLTLMPAFLPPVTLHEFGSELPLYSPLQSPKLENRNSSVFIHQSHYF